jgi:hypothetical protein
MKDPFLRRLRDFNERLSLSPAFWGTREGIPAKRLLSASDTWAGQDMGSGDGICNTCLLHLEMDRSKGGEDVERPRILPSFA